MLPTSLMLRTRRDSEEQKKNEEKERYSATDQPRLDLSFLTFFVVAQRTPFWREQQLGPN